MSKGLLRAIIEAVLVSVFLMGCRPAAPPHAAAPKLDYSAPLPEGEMALRKLAPDRYPDFSEAVSGTNLADLRRSADNSLAYLSRPSSEKAYPYLDISHERAVATVKAFRVMLDHPPSPGAMNAAIAQTFEVYQSVGAPNPDGSGYTQSVLFTGYFTPTYDASPTRTGPYQWPLYKRPADLVTDESGENGGRRLNDGSIVAYPTRREIESGALAGQELVWLTSRWNAYVITVQGSARLRLPDGRIEEIGYAGTNCRPYSSPGQQMIADGVLTRDQMSFRGLKEYFDGHPEAMDKYLWLNDRTVFFTDRRGGPFGALNVPVTPFCSIATDKHVYPAALVAFLSVPMAMPERPAQSEQFNVFLLDQDRGGAIRSAGRCDIYMGIGDRAEDISGRQLSPGALYYLAVKPELIGRYSAAK